MLQTLYDHAKFQYNCGNYSGAAEMLYHFRILVSCLHYSLFYNIAFIINIFYNFSLLMKT